MKKINVLNSGSKESAEEKITKPLRGVFGGRKITTEQSGSGKEIYSPLKRMGIGVLLFTIGLPYTLIAGGLLAKSALHQKLFKKGMPIRKPTLEILGEESSSTSKKKPVKFHWV